MRENRAAIIVQGICRDKKIAQIEKDKLLYDAARVYHRANESTEERRRIKEKNIKSLDYDSKKD